jgi:AraC-like DNA-binding protein
LIQINERIGESGKAAPVYRIRAQGVAMPSSIVQRFTDPDAYAAAARHAAIQLTVTGRGQFAANLVRIDFHRLWMQRFSDTLPKIVRSDRAGGRVIVSFRTNAGPSLTWNGMELQPSAVIRTKNGGSSDHRSSGGSGFGSMSLSIDDMASVSTAMAGLNLAASDDTLVMRPSPSSIATLKRLHAAAGHLAETAPEVIAHPETARGLEQALVEAMVNCLSSADTIEERSAQRRHELIMRRFHELVEKQLDRALYVPEICRAIGVSEATLRACCHERLGRSPKQYLLARRMHLAHRDLSRTIPGATTVTDIAMRYGFWQFGRFAGAYQALFGELPSTTLGHAPE